MKNVCLAHFFANNTGCFRNKRPYFIFVLYEPKKEHKNMCPRAICFRGKTTLSEYEKGSFMCSSTKRTPRSSVVKDLYVKCTNVDVAVTILSFFDRSI
jgi:hypothetical protein